MLKNKAKDIMTINIITIDEDDTFLKASTLMKKYDIGFLPIMNEAIVVGVITDRDMIIRGIANKEDYNAKISKYMTQEIIFVDSNTSIEKASELMAEKQIKRLLIIDNNILVGIISLADITNHKNEKALVVLTEINKKYKKNHFSNNPKIDDFYL